MINRYRYALVAMAAVVFLGPIAKADDPKELKTTKGKTIIVANFISARSDCSLNPGPSPVPLLREKPRNGVVQMLIVATDVAASDSCPARKIPSIGLVYTPNPDFVGTDSIQLEVEGGNNKIATAAYRIIVQPADDK